MSFDPAPARKTSRRSPKQCAERPSLPERKTSFERIVELCTVRDRSTFELATRLTKDGYTSEAIDEGIKRACDCNLVNDERFAEVWVRSMLARGKGERFIERELAQKHQLSVEDIPGWPDDFLDNFGSELERALDLLRQKPIRAKNAYASAYRRLVSRGFSAHTAYQACDVFFNQSEDNDI